MEIAKNETDRYLDTTLSKTLNDISLNQSAVNVKCIENVIEVQKVSNSSNSDFKSLVASQK